MYMSRTIHRRLPPFDFCKGCFQYFVHFRRISWAVHALSTNARWSVHGHPTCCPWTPDELPMATPRTVQSMDTPRTSHGNPINYPSTDDRLSTNYLRNFHRCPHGRPTDCPWAPHKLSMENPPTPNAQPTDCPAHGRPVG